MVLKTAVAIALALVLIGAAFAQSVPPGTSGTMQACSYIVINGVKTPQPNVLTNFTSTRTQLSGGHNHPGGPAMQLTYTSMYTTADGCAYNPLRVPNYSGLYTATATAPSVPPPYNTAVINVTAINPIVSNQIARYQADPLHPNNNWVTSTTASRVGAFSLVMQANTPPIYIQLYGHPFFVQYLRGTNSQGGDLDTPGMESLWNPVYTNESHIAGTSADFVTPDSYNLPNMVGAAQAAYCVATATPQAGYKHLSAN